MSTHLKLQAWGEQCGCSSNVWRAVRLLLQGSWHGLSVHYSSKVCSVAVKIRAKVEEIVKRLTMREEEVAAMEGCSKGRYRDGGCRACALKQFTLEERCTRQRHNSKIWGLTLESS